MDVSARMKPWRSRWNGMRSRYESMFMAIPKQQKSAILASELCSVVYRDPDPPRRLFMASLVMMPSLLPSVVLLCPCYSQRTE